MLRLLTCASAVCLLAVGAGVAAAVSERGQRNRVEALQRLASVATTDSNTHPAAASRGPQHPIPARMLASGTPVPVPPSILRLRNGWLVCDGRRLVAVYAGAAGNDPAVGRLVIVRQDLAAGSQIVRTIDTGSTGAVSISAAPRGGSVVTSAQTGELSLTSSSGRALRLDLGSGTVAGG